MKSVWIVTYWDLSVADVFCGAFTSREAALEFARKDAAASKIGVIEAPRSEQQEADEYLLVSEERLDRTFEEREALAAQRLAEVLEELAREPEPEPVANPDNTFLRLVWDDGEVVG